MTKLVNLEVRSKKELELSVSKIGYCNVCNTHFHIDWDEMNSLDTYSCPFCYSEEILEIKDRMVRIKANSKAQAQVKFARDTYYEPKHYLM